MQIFFAVKDLRDALSLKFMTSKVLEALFF